MNKYERKHLKYKNEYINMKGYMVGGATILIKDNYDNEYNSLEVSDNITKDVLLNKSIKLYKIPNEWIMKIIFNDKPLTDTQIKVTQFSNNNLKIIYGSINILELVNLYNEAIKEYNSMLSDDEKAEYEIKEPINDKSDGKHAKLINKKYNDIESDDRYKFDNLFKSIKVFYNIIEGINKSIDYSGKIKEKIPSGTNKVWIKNETDLSKILETKVSNVDDILNLIYNDKGAIDLKTT